MNNRQSEQRGSDYLYDALVDSDIDLLIGLPGTQTLPLDRTVAQRDEMRYVMARHETAIPHIAWGYYESGGEMAATLTVPGPGDTNAMHGLKNALDDCVPIVHISADANPEDRGKGPIHEIEHETFDNVVKENYPIKRPIEFLEQVRDGIETARTPPYGPVRLGIPSGLLDREFTTLDIDIQRSTNTFAGDREYRTAAEHLIAAERPVIYVGGGTRRSPESRPAVQRLAEHLNAPVVSSYKGKGVYPEDNPHFLGITASHLPTGARHVLGEADVVLALGTNFDGITTDNWSIPFGETLIHVNIDASDIGTAYEADVAIADDAAAAAERLFDLTEQERRPVSAWDGAAIANSVREEYIDHLASRGLLNEETPINTPAVLRTLREVLPRDTVVTTDVGGFRLWAAQVFETYDQESYITAGSWAGMGLGLPAAVGAQLANPNQPVVSLTGDGGLMMCLQELHTAVDYDLNVITIVFNNADYGVISKSPKIDQYTDSHRFQWTSPDFATIAEGFGCQSETVETLSGVRNAINTALSREKGPELIDVQIDPTEPTAAAASEYDSSLEF